MIIPNFVKGVVVMRNLICRCCVLLLLLSLVLSLFPLMGGLIQVRAANLSTDIYQLPSKTMNDAGTLYRQNMSYIIRTRNGKIIVIDGGYSTDNKDANYLISQLKSITGKEVPNVDAWFFSHNHADHVGAFKAIAARMPMALTVSAVYYRFPTDAEIDKYAPESDRESLKTSVRSFQNHVKLMKQANGQPTQTVTVSARHVNRCKGSFNIDTVRVDVLLTCEETFWGCDNITTKYSGSLSTNGKSYSSQTIKQLVNADFGNSTSMVIRLTTMGQSAIFLGDASEPTGLVLRYFHEQNAANANKYFSLKSDICQMAHHGQNGVPKNVYTAINPKIALWPCPDWVYNPSSSSGLTTAYTKQWMSALGATNYVSKDGLKKISMNDLRTTAQPTIPEEMKPLLFDATYYGNKYPDVYKAFNGDPDLMYNHFLKYGIEEGRCASPYFDIRYYMSQNSPRMADYCKGDYEKGLEHFLKLAYDEGELAGGAKKLSPIFDCKYYYNNYPILKELGLNTEFLILQYFVQSGEAAGHKAAQEVVTLNGGIVYHPASPLAAVAPTCTAEGKTSGSCCAICGMILRAQSAVAPTGHTEVIDSALVPTCTSTGLTQGKHCSVCNAVLLAQVTLPATGHSYSYSRLDALTHQASCQNCEDSRVEAHSYTEGFCLCGEPEVKEPIEDSSWKLNHSLNLASDISVNLLVSKSLLEGFDLSTVYVESTVYGGEGTNSLKLYPVENGDYYYFTLNGLTAVQMNDRISSVLHGSKQGQPYCSPTDEYSIATYAYSQLNNTARPTALKKLCADLLRYGAKAQIFKGYRTDSLADSAMTADNRSYLSDLEAVTFGSTDTVLNDVPDAPIVWVGKALNLESKVALKFVFDPAAYTGELSKLSLQVRYTDARGNAKLLILEEIELYNEEKNLYAFTVDALLAAELRAVVSVQIFDGSYPMSSTLRYSPDTYGNNKKGALLDLCKALFAYSDSARAYFAG